MQKTVGHFAFIVGIIIAVVLGIFSAWMQPAVPALTSILILLGLIVGFLNVTGKETREFLIVAVILVIASYAGGATESLSTVMYIGPYLSGIFAAIMAFVVPATVVVGLKEIYALAMVK